jgi:1-acyl-sn-glycerol-3-phosphate acyltransferase
MGTLSRALATAGCLASGAWRARHVAGLDADTRLGLQQAWMERLGRALGIEVFVTGEPPPSRALWVANHVSWLDVMALGRLRALHFVAKHDVGEWPLIGRLASASGTRFVDREGRRGLRTLVEDLAAQLDAGRSVAIFPEGTTTPGDVLLRFKPLLFQAAVLAKAPVQPVTLRYVEQGPRRIAPYLGDDLFVSHLGRVLRCPPRRVEVHFLPRMQVPDTAAHLLARHSARMIAESLGVPVMNARRASAASESLNLDWGHAGS